MDELMHKANGSAEPIRAHSPEGIRQNERHASRVERVAQQLRNRRSTAPLSRQKRVVSHQVPKVHDKKHTDEKLNVRDFDQVIEIDPDRRICIAEPGYRSANWWRKPFPTGWCQSWSRS